MKVQLLILLALAGPFCGITRASPTGLPTEKGGATDATPDITEGKVQHVVVTGAPSTQPEAVPAKAATEAAPEAAPEATTEPATEATTEATPEATPEVATGAATGAATDFATKAVTAMATAFTTQAAATDLPTATTKLVEVTQEVLVVNTSVPTDGLVAEKTNTSEEEDNVVVEDEGLSSGQVVGVVIGALIAVVIVIAVVIAFVRRMGKYSP
ncbi:unnamed protein product [Lota lota]